MKSRVCVCEKTRDCGNCLGRLSTSGVNLPGTQSEKSSISCESEFPVRIPDFAPVETSKPPITRGKGEAVRTNVRGREDRAGEQKLEPRFTLFLSRIPVHTTAPNNLPLSLSLSLSPIRRSLSSKIVVSPLEERERKKERQLSHASGGDSGWILGGVAENPDCCRLSYCRDRFESRFHAALLGIIQSGRGMAAPVRGGWRLSRIESFQKGETRHPASARSAIGWFTVRMKSEFGREDCPETGFLLVFFSFFFFPSFFSFAEDFSLPLSAACSASYNISRHVRGISRKDSS